MATYNGHKNWNHWNVSLWINNDENLYKAAKYWVENCNSKAQATMCFIREQLECGNKKTPDGAPYSKSSVRAALAGL